MGTYLRIILDENGRVVAIYPGSGTAKLGIGARWIGYDNVIANARLGTLPADMHKFSSCSYMRLLVKTQEGLYLSHQAIAEGQAVGSKTIARHRF